MWKLILLKSGEGHKHNRNLHRFSVDLGKWTSTLSLIIDTLLSMVHCWGSCAVSGSMPSLGLGLRFNS